MPKTSNNSKEAPSALRLDKVTLFKNNLGWYSHTATGRSGRLDVQTDNKNMVIDTLSYHSEAPVTVTFGYDGPKRPAADEAEEPVFRFALGEGCGVASWLGSCVGAEVSVTTSGRPGSADERPIRGKIMLLEKETVAIPGSEGKTHSVHTALHLLDTQQFKVQRIPLSEIQVRQRMDLVMQQQYRSPCSCCPSARPGG
jgi:hypothetical protein